MKFLILREIENQKVKKIPFCKQEELVCQVFRLYFRSKIDLEDLSFCFHFLLLNYSISFNFALLSFSLFINFFVVDHLFLRKSFYFVNQKGSLNHSFFFVMLSK